MQKPNFFMIGEPKCGTTIMHRYLSSHKDIFMSNPKEPHYFNTDHHQEAIGFHGKTEAKILFQYMKQNDYYRLFQHNGRYKIQGEASTNYAYSKISAQNIYNFKKNSQILYCIREPLSFLQSFHAQTCKISYENVSNFLKALQLEKIRKKKKDRLLSKNVGYPSCLFYSERIKFSDHLQRYLNHFPSEQIKVIIYEEFKNNNQKTIDEITDFLGVERMEIEYKKVNVRAKPRFMRLKRFFTNSYKIRSIAQKILPYSIRKARGNFTRWINPLIPEKAPELPQHEVTRLKKQFKPEVVKINDLLHKHNLIDPKIDLVEYRGYDKV